MQNCSMIAITECPPDAWQAPGQFALDPPHGALAGQDALLVAPLGYKIAEMDVIFARRLNHDAVGYIVSAWLCGADGRPIDKLRLYPWRDMHSFLLRRSPQARADLRIMRS